eukprot:m.61347 g.61347  ORF g.61347 m.61347 type:complete len:566 (+) comp7333_c0_seq1:239-1936(+)
MGTSAPIPRTTAVLVAVLSTALLGHLCAAFAACQGDACPALCDCSNYESNGTSMARVQCVDRNLSYVPCTYPQDAPLGELLFTFNDIHNISAEFGRMTFATLELLDLSHNSITVVPIGSFDGLRGQGQLLLNNNFIQELQPGAFVQANNLTTLNLANNSLAVIATDTFLGLGSVTQLDLSNNPLRALQQYAFRGLDSLRNLQLPDANITMIPALAFATLRLETLELGLNPITVLSTNAFSGLTLLGDGVLDLSALPLTSIESRAFEQINLTSIILPITLQTLQPYAFSGIGHLTKLDLSATKVSAFPEGTFYESNQLATILFQPTHIKSLGPRVFSRTAVSTINLQASAISELPASAFDDVPQLTTIVLANCHGLTRLVPGTFVNLPLLHSVSLSITSLTWASDNAFVNCPKVAVLDLSWTHFPYLPQRLIESLPNLQALCLFATHMDCCEMSWLPSASYVDKSPCQHKPSRCSNSSPIRKFDVRTCPKHKSSTKTYIIAGTLGGAVLLIVAVALVVRHKRKRQGTDDELRPFAGSLLSPASSPKRQVPEHLQVPNIFEDSDEEA